MREYFNEINGIKPIELWDIPEDEHMYEPNEFEGFQHVFTKDNMPTYHQMYDNFLHWNWNEYHNDKTRFESEQYINSVLNKVFTWFNARLLGIVNNGQDHPVIIQLLLNMVDETLHQGHGVHFSGRAEVGLNLMEVLAKKRNELEGRLTPFTEDDAIIWWTKTEKVYLQKLFKGIKQKPLIIPIIHLPEHIDVSLSDHFDQLYLMLFGYVLKYYNHVYGAKFQSTWVQVDRKDSIMAQEVDPSSNHLILVNRNLFDTMREISGFKIEEGQVIPVYIASDDGDMWDHWMDTYTVANITRHEGKYYISSRRGFNLFHNNLGNFTKEFVETLVAKGKDHEALRTEMWRDVMESGAVLFPWDNLQQVQIEVRITNWPRYQEILNEIIVAGFRNLSTIKRAVKYDVPQSARYSHPIPVEEINDQNPNLHVPHENGKPTFQFTEMIFDQDGTAILTISDLSVLLKFWEVMEHTLDFWVKFEDRWSLVCNIQEKDMQFYLNNSHIRHTMWKDTYYEIDQLPDGKVLSIIPRDGMTWTTLGMNDHREWHTYVNDLRLKKIYY